MTRPTVALAGALLACVFIAPSSDADAAGPGAATGGTVTAEAAPASGDSIGLGPTTAPPWNPPAATSGDAAWESVLKAPGYLLGLPFAAVGPPGGS